MITTNLLDGKYACPGQEIVFTCTTNGSPSVAWISDDYIGINGHSLEFINSEPIGHRLKSTVNPDTYAELTMKTGPGPQDLVTESQLHISVSHDISTATVKCSDVGNDSSSSVHFELLCKFSASLVLRYLINHSIGN